jgi:hypothetical protein
MERSAIEGGGVKVAMFACVESTISFHFIEATLAKESITVNYGIKH